MHIYPMYMLVLDKGNSTDQSRTSAHDRNVVFASYFTEKNFIFQNRNYIAENKYVTSLKFNIEDTTKNNKNSFFLIDFYNICVFNI